MTKIALFGAAGAIGRSIASALRQAKQPYRVVGRSLAALRKEFGADPLAEVVSWNPDDPDSVRAAARGIETGDDIEVQSATGSLAATANVDAQGRFLIEHLRFDDESEPGSATVYSVNFNSATVNGQGLNGGSVSTQATLMTLPR